MNNKRTVLCLIALSIFLVSANAFSATATGIATVNVRDTLAVKKIKNLYIKGIKPLKKPFSLTITPTNVLLVNGKVRFKKKIKHSPAIFEVTGDRNTRYRIDLPETITKNNVTAHSFRIHSLTSGRVDDYANLNSMGRDRLSIGATIDILSPIKKNIVVNIPVNVYYE